MPSNAFVLIGLGLTLGQVVGHAQDFTLRRFGSVPVSDSEVAQIEELVISNGKRPWLLRSLQTMELEVRLAYVFLEPDLIGGRVHRGRALTLRADGPRFGPPRTPWRLEASQLYAYLPTQGRLAGEIRSEGDTTWPFTIHGEFNDATLVSLIEFIRSGPPLPIVHKNQANRHLRRDVPVSVVARRNGGILVGLRTGDLQGENVTIVRRNDKWLITEFGMWIA